MITTGSKLFFALAGAAFFAAVVYGVITNGIDHGGIVSVLSGDGAVDALLGPITFGYKGGVGDHVGYAILMGFAGASFGLGFATSAFRDADAEALAQLDGVEAAATAVPTTALNAWPFVGALAAMAVVVGLATSPVLFVIGCSALVVVAVEWTISSWAESRTVDQTANRLIRNRIMLPIEVPVGAVLLAVALVYCISRILLAVSEAGAVWVALVLAALILGVAVLLNSRPQMKRSLVIGVLVVGAVVVLAVGIVGAVIGPRSVERHGPLEGAAPSAITSAPGQEG